MKHTETLTRYTASFVDELANNGLTDVVISPGSRSTPLALTFAEHPRICHWVNMDERSAAFFAMGMARQQNKPVAVLCTSGTAAANYYPAVVEACYSRIPLLVLTADRPHELRDAGAPQAINQLNFYGSFVKWFHEMALPEASTVMLAYARNKAARACLTSRQANPGPVHLNFPFREPLIPDFSLEGLWSREEKTPFLIDRKGSKQIGKEEAEVLLRQLNDKKRGLLVCGPQLEESLAADIALLAKAWNVPVLADPLSQLRAGSHEKDYIMESYDAVLKSEKIRKELVPDFIIRFGAMPVSKAYLSFMKENADVLHIVVEEEGGYREPAGVSTQYFHVNPGQLCRTFASCTGFSFDSEWMNTWGKINKLAKRHLLMENDTGELTEGDTVRYLLETVPDRSILFTGNSMPVRDLDSFFMTTPKQLRVFGNRGANGIDGIISSALGAAAHGERVTLVLGDLSFFHDFNALQFARQYSLSLTVVLINNNGGGIFSFLPQANQQDHFETLFGTPLDIEFQPVVEMYGGRYWKSSSREELQQSLADSYQRPGLTVIEVETNREENVHWHRAKWQTIEEHIWKHLKG